MTATRDQQTLEAIRDLLDSVDFARDMELWTNAEEIYDRIPVVLAELVGSGDEAATFAEAVRMASHDLFRENA